MKKLSLFLTLAIGTPLPQLASSLQIDGAMVDAGGMVGTLASAFQYSQAANSQNFQSSSATTITLTALQSLYQKLTAGSATTVTLDSAYNIVNTIPAAYLGMTFGFEIFSSGAGTVATPTLTDTTVTLVGTTSIVAGNERMYQAQITQLTTTIGAPLTAGTTFVSLAQVGTTNNYTLTLATNTLVPVVGTAIYLNVSAGTLPAGWYPIVKVTSATVIIIGLPPTSPAWTATAATLPGTIAIPSSAWSTGLPGLYAPLITITAMRSVAAIV